MAQVPDVEAEFREWLEKAYRVLAVAVHRYGGPTEDILHDTLIHLIERRGTITSYEMLLGYALRLAKWRAIDAHRKASREELVADPEQLLQTAQAQHQGDFAPEADLMVRDTLAHQLAQLPPRARDVMARTIAGESSEDIAAALDIAPATVRSLIRRARFRLANQGEGHG